MHMPQPLQSVLLTCMSVRPKRAGLATIASNSHSSMHRTQLVPCLATQESDITARNCQCGLPVSRICCSAPGSQTAAQSPQKVQPACEKSSKGSFLSDMTTIFCSQAMTQFPQPSQAAANSDSTSAPGGRISGLLPRQSPRKNCDLEIKLMHARDPTRGHSIPDHRLDEFLLEVLTYINS